MNISKLKTLAALLAIASPACSANRTSSSGAASANSDAAGLTSEKTVDTQSPPGEREAANDSESPAREQPRTSEYSAPKSSQSAEAKAVTAPDAAPRADAASTRTPDVVFVPTPQPVVDKMLALARIKKTDVVYDLGCGDGRIVVTAAKRYGVRAFGFDIDPKRVQEAKENVKTNGVENLVTIEQRDIFTLDLSPANVVTLYLLPELNVRLIPQLEKLRPGSRIVSHDFDMQGVTPVNHLTVNPAGESRSHEIYLWNVPLKKEGRASKL